MTFEHVPVMGREVTELFAAVPTGTVVDATVGGGGHARLLLESRSDLRILGIDRDRQAVDAATEALRPYEDRARVVHGGFEHLAERIESEGSDIVGILFDLGVSSPQLDRRTRGFSYWDDAPLDMRMDSSQELTAEQVLNEYPEGLLAELIATNGEERFARRIARAIVATRPLRTSSDLVAAVKVGIPARARRRGGHPARRTFQAIRMEVNRELPNLAEGLDESVHVIAPGGRILVVAYHSLEDRMVKERFAEWSGTAPTPPGPPTVRPTPRTRLLTRRPRRPSDEEIARNPRSSSARMRAVEKLRAS